MGMKGLIVMATQIFKPEITLVKEDVGNSISWSYTYDGEFIRFFYGVEEKPRIEKKFPLDAVCVFVANGRYSEVYYKLEPPRNHIYKMFWKYGFSKAHFIEEPSFSAYGYEYEWYPHSSNPKTVKIPNKWNTEKALIYKDMILNGKLIASAFVNYADTDLDVDKWFWFDKELFTEELCKEFFNGCPINNRWDILRG